MWPSLVMPSGFVPDPAVSSAPLLHFCLEHVAFAALQFVADSAFVIAELGPVTVVELLHDLKRPTAVQNVATDELGLQLIGRRTVPGGPQLVACLAEQEVGVPDQLVERVEVSAGAFDVLEGLRDLSDRFDRGILDTRRPSSDGVVAVVGHRWGIPR